VLQPSDAGGVFPEDYRRTLMAHLFKHLSAPISGIEVMMDAI
jgi:hypothetical protein